MAHVFDSPLFDMHGPFSEPPKWECDDDCIAEWLDEAANMSDRVFTPSDSFIFPSYLHAQPSFILTGKSLNLWYPIPFILTASLSLSLSICISLSLSLCVLWRASLIKMASAFHLFFKVWPESVYSLRAMLAYFYHLVSSLFRHCSFNCTTLDCSS